jgi:hypothetical protein
MPFRPLSNQMRNSIKFVASLSILIATVPACRVERPRDESCFVNLREISVQKVNWQLEFHKATNDTPTWEDLRKYFKSVPLKCPKGGTYTIGRIGEWPSCSILEHEAYFKEYTKRQ